MTTHYDTLEVSPKASIETIKAAYKSLSLKFHPDRATGNAEKFRAIADAYGTLSDPKTRKAYDQSLLIKKERGRTANGNGNETERRAPRHTPIVTPVPPVPVNGMLPIDGLIKFGLDHIAKFGDPATQTIYKHMRPDITQLATNGLLSLFKKMGAK